MANIHSVITYNANLSPAQAQIKALTGQIAGLTAAFNTLDKSALSAQRSLATTFATNVGQIGGFTAKTVQAHSAVEGFGKALAANRLTMRQYFREAFAGYTRQNSMLKQLAIQQVKYQQSIAVSTAAGQAMMITPAQVNALTSSTAIAAQKFSIFNKLIDGGATSLLNFGKNTQWAGRQLMVGFTIPLALFTAAVSKQFRDLDKELTRFQKVYGQDLGNSVKNSTIQMREQIQQLAFDIGKNYGIAAKDTAALAADIAATGAEGEKLVKSVQETTRLSVLGEVDRQEAMKTTLALQSAFKMNTDELTESINFLNAVENQTSATLQDFSAAIPKVGPVIQSLGGDIQDLAMMLVAMREGGVPAAEAANAIKSGLASMINPTQKASDVAEKFGVNLNKIVEDNKGQLMPTIYAMQDALQGLDDFSRARVIEEIFGKYQFARMSALFENLGRMGSQTQSVLELTAKSSVELAGIANAELKTLQESTAMKFQRSLEQLRNTLIPVGEALTETLIPVFEFIGSAAGKFIEFFQALPEPIKNFAKYGTAIAALAGPVIMLVGLFGNLIANGIKFGMMMVRLGARIAGLRVEKFELLNEEVMAAKLGVDTLTGSFTTQEKALRQLIGAMSSYGASLRTLQSTNPALFVPTAGRPPIKRADGSSSPEFVPGSGRGDKIPAMLEPGEFVVNRKATEKYAPVLMQMNRGNLPGYQNGTSSPVEFGKGQYSAPTSVAARSPVGEGMARGHIFGTGREAKALKISGDYFLWHKNFWIEISQEENQLMNILQLSSKKNQPLFQKTLQGMNVDQAMTERIMAKIRSGVMFSEDEARVAHVAIRKLATQIEQGQIPAKEMTKALGKYATSVSNLPQLTSLSLEKIRAAERQLITGITSISTTSGPEAERAKALLAEKLLLVRGLIQQVGAAPVAISAEIAKILQMASPSRIFEQIGRNTADGLLKGIKTLEGSARQAGVELGDEIILGVRSVSGNGGLSSSQTRGAVIIGSGPGPTSPIGAKPGGTTFLGMPSMPERRGAVSAGLTDTYKASRGQGAMNMMFMGSMLASSVSMMSGASEEAAGKLSMFTSALMVATMAMQTMSGKGMLTNFMGMGSLGKAISGLGGGAGMLGRIGAGVGMLGGPIGIGIAAATTAAIGGFILYKNAADEARARAVAAFDDPIKSAEYFGTTIKDVSQIIEESQLAALNEDLKGIDENLRAVVKEDYAPLIEKISKLTAGAGARELGLAYSNMIVAGMTAEQAKAAVQAIAAEAGIAGGEAFSRGMIQGMFTNQTVEQAIGNIMTQFDPTSNQALVAETQGQLAYLESQRSQFEAQIAQYNMNPAAMPDFDFGAAVQAYNDLSDSIDQTKTALDEMTNINPDLVVPVFESLIRAYQTNPQAAIDGIDMMVSSINKLSEDDQLTAIENIETFLKENYGDQWALFGSTIDQSNEKLLAAKMLAAGITLDTAIDSSGQFNENLAQTAIAAKIAADETERLNTELKDALKTELVEEVDTQLRGVEKTLTKLNNRLEYTTEFRERHLGVLKKEFNQEQRNSESAIEGMEDQISVIEERAAIKNEEYENTIKGLEKEKEKISESTDAYIKSIQKRQRVDSFYANQRKSGLSALQRLASGDVFGFLQERTAMGQEAQQFSYDNQIKQIEDRRDAEIDAIDKTIEKEKERQDEFEKNTRDRIDGINDEIAAERDLMDEREKAYDREIRIFERKMKAREEDINDAVDKENKKRERLENIRGRINNGEVIAKSTLYKLLDERDAVYFENYQKRVLLSTFETVKLNAIAEKMSPSAANQQAYQAVAADIAKLRGAAAQGTSMAERITYDLGYLNTPTPTPNSQYFGSGDTYNRASGGPISGPGGPKSDVIPAMLSNGEYVIQASSVKKYGTGLMDAINTQKYAEGGEVSPRLNTRSISNGPNDWPFISSYSSPLLATGKIPGTNINMTMRKEVLPLFLALASEYNKTIKKIGTGSGGYDPRLDRPEDERAASNHPSGTAMDLNWGEEGAKSNSTDLFNWWKSGIVSAGAPWKPLSPTPYKTALNLMRKYKIVDWFGPDELGGYITGTPDYMHWQISQSGARIGPERVREVIKELGISDEGKIESTPTSGSKPPRPGTPQSSPASSQGIGYSPFGGQRNVYGKASPSFITGRMLPAPGGGKKEDGGKGGGNNNPGSAVGSGTFKTPLPYGADAAKAKIVLDSVKASWPQNLHQAAWTIAMRESLGENLGPGHPDFNGSDYGIFQVNKGAYGQQSWWDENKLLNPMYNARVSYTGVSRSGASFLPWAMKVNNNGAGYSWDWSLYGGVPSWGHSWTMPATKAFWGSWVKKANGGFISGQGGPRSDMIPALLSNGEYVMKSTAVDKYGRGFMDQINSGNFNMPSFGMPSMPAAPPSSIATNVSGDSYSSSNSSNNVKIIINGASGKSATAIANKVASMINSSNNRRNHSRSI